MTRDEISAMAREAGYPHAGLQWNDQEMAFLERFAALVAVAPAQPAAIPHPACKADMRVNGGALKLALNVLRRAGKNEVADELEATAQAGSVQEDAIAVLRADLKAAAKEIADEYAKDAARYQLVRRGQHWSVIDGIGEILRGEALDAAIDAARAAQEGK